VTGATACIKSDSHSTHAQQLPCQDLLITDKAGWWLPPRLREGFDKIGGPHLHGSNARTAVAGGAPHATTSTRNSLQTPRREDVAGNMTDLVAAWTAGLLSSVSGDLAVFYRMTMTR
jgi:hypothetical protein